jgi:hydrogenase maturation protein HypF
MVSGEDVMDGTESVGNQVRTITVHGIVQGVGFRPFVYGCARRLGLCGHVINSGQGVEIIASGPAAALDTFVYALETEAPPLARVEEVRVIRVPDSLYQGSDFVINESRSGSNTTLISPDAAICEECVHDIFSPDNRRFLYPFTNCTNCGPRLTIINKMPYDRLQTSMAEFIMCPTCAREYENPADRRFHAQPNACPDCGPTISWHERGGRKITADNRNCLTLCAQALQAGKIVAIKGLGGFHLVVDGRNSKAVAQLRQRKNRYGKPLAVMVASVTRAQEIGCFNHREEGILTSLHRPIVVVRKQRKSRLSEHVAPNIDQVGIMLAYTPLHHLLFAQPDCPELLVMTSGNPTGDPLCITNKDALDRLAHIADNFLLHNRDIITRVDDSVVQVVRNREQIIRRARGYVPVPVAVDQVCGTILACGAELKNCFALARKGMVFLSQHIGDLKGPATLDFFAESIRYMRDVLDISPDVVVCDQHPDYLSTRFAEQCGLDSLKVQHHHAHAAAIMAEHGLDRGLAVIFDGAGFGSDATVWGGEFLAVQGAEFERFGHLQPFHLPGGDLATREIWRVGLSLVHASGFTVDDLPPCLHGLQEIAPDKRQAIGQLMEKKINSPLCSSIGRLFDAVASLLNLRQHVEFEGQAAMELESLAWQFFLKNPEAAAGSHYREMIYENDNVHFMDFTRLVQQLIDDLALGKNQAELAFNFHLWLVHSTAAMIEQCRQQEGNISAKNTNILLGGGCFQNRILLELLAECLEKKGLNVFTAEQVPVNDGGIALGQVYVASMQKK